MPAQIGWQPCHERWQYLGVVGDMLWRSQGFGRLDKGGEDATLGQPGVLPQQGVVGQRLAGRHHDAAHFKEVNASRLRY